MSRKSRKSADLGETTGSAPRSLGRKLLRMVVLGALGFAASKVLRSATGTAPVATPAPVPTPPAPAPKVETTPPPAVEIPTSPVEPRPAPELISEVPAATPEAPEQPVNDVLETKTPKSQIPDVPADSLTSFFDDVLTENQDAKRQG